MGDRVPGVLVMFVGSWERQLAGSSVSVRVPASAGAGWLPVFVDAATAREHYPDAELVEVMLPAWVQKEAGDAAP